MVGRMGGRKEERTEGRHNRKNKVTEKRHKELKKGRVRMKK